MTFRSGPKPTQISINPKAKRKRYQWKPKVQEWFGMSGPEEGLPDLKDVVFLTMLGRLGFSLRSKAEEVGKWYQQLTKWEPNPSKIKPRGPLGGGQGGQGGGWREGNQKNPYF